MTHGGGLTSRQRCSQCILQPQLTRLNKFRLIKLFAKALLKDGSCFKYLFSKFPSLSEAKLKKRIFSEVDIRKLISDAEFNGAMNLKQEVCISFKEKLNYKNPNKKNCGKFDQSVGLQRVSKYVFLDTL